MGLGEFYIFAAIFGYFIMTVGGLMILAYQMKNYKMIFFLRVFLVIFTISGFINIFADNMIFTDANPESLESFAYPG